MKSSGYQWHADDPHGYANAMGRYKTAREMAFVREHLGGDRLDILDIGGGSGRFALPLAEEGHNVTVVDVSREALARLSSHNNANVTSICDDFCSLNLDRLFDAVIAIEAVQYFVTVDLAHLFAKVRRVMRPHAHFVFTELNSRSWRYRLHRLRRRRPQYNVGGPKDYIDALTRAGLAVVKIDGLLWMPFSVTSRSPAIPAFAAFEQTFRLNRWHGQSPWLLIAARRAEDQSNPLIV